MPEPDRSAPSEGRLPGVTCVHPSGEVRLRALVETHYAFVWRSLRRLGCPHGDADDGAQRVFLVAARRLTAILPGSERSFLYQTALRVAADARRTERRRREDPPLDEAVPCGDLPPDELVDLRRARVRLDEILDALPLEARAVFTLFELEQMTLTEIAALLSVPRGTVASRLRRARAAFHREASELGAPGDRFAGARTPPGEDGT
jgi:RNA polymerase sigma-70 factor (ECF subfamily)